MPPRTEEKQTRKLDPKLLGYLNFLKSRRAKADLLFFAREIAGFDRVAEETHRPLCAVLQSKNKQKKLILMPRGTFKSSIASIAYPLWCAWKDPDVRILIDSETYTNSTSYIQSISNIITKSKDFHFVAGHLYPKRYAERWSSDSLTVTTRKKINLKEPTLSAGSLDVVKVGMHYDKIICDDLVSDQNIKTKEQIDKVIDHFKLLIPMLEPGGEMVIIGTRWHYGDLYEYILEKLSDEFEVLTAKAEEEPEKPGDPNKLNFPHILSRKFLDTVKKIMGASMYACQYLNEIVSKETQLFKNISYYKELPKLLVYTITLDPAISQEKNSCFSAFTVVGTDYRNNMYVLEASQKRMSPTELINMIFLLNKIFHPQIFAIEEIGFQQMIGWAVKEQMIKRDEWINIKPIKFHTHSKEQRIVGLHPRIATGTMMIKPGLTDLEDALLRYPKIKYLDILDALSMQLEIHSEVVVDAPQTFEEDMREVDLMLLRKAPPIRRKLNVAAVDVHLGNEY